MKGRKKGESGSKLMGHHKEVFRSKGLARVSKSSLYGQTYGLSIYSSSPLPRHPHLRILYFFLFSFLFFELIHLCSASPSSSF